MSETGKHRPKERAAIKASRLIAHASTDQVRVSTQQSAAGDNLAAAAGAHKYVCDLSKIVIDSADDRRNAYTFQINPLGAQRDA